MKTLNQVMLGDAIWRGHYDFGVYDWTGHNLIQPSSTTTLWLRSSAPTIENITHLHQLRVERPTPGVFGNLEMR